MQLKEDNPGELVQMVETNGMIELPEPDVALKSCIRHSSVPNTLDNAPEARHLWVIRQADFPVALESCPWGSSLQSGKIKHSNLTGGADAHSGGEIWFVGEKQIVVNARSGRYGARSDDEFGHIVDALRRAGYHVASMGFDIDNATVANRVLVGALNWQAPI